MKNEICVNVNTDDVKVAADVIETEMIANNSNKVKLPVSHLEMVFLGAFLGHADLKIELNSEIQVAFESFLPKMKSYGHIIKELTSRDKVHNLSFVFQIVE